MPVRDSRPTGAASSPSVEDTGALLFPAQVREIKEMARVRELRARDHGGDLDAAVARHGGPWHRWIDLSTGINRVPYPVGDIPPSSWQRLPTRADMNRLIAAARAAYGTGAPLLPVAGAQAAIQLVPGLAPAGRAAILGPTYNEHRAALEARGWQVREESRLEDLAGADLAVVVHPNNPDGRRHGRGRLLDLAAQVGRLVLDESFMDATPEDSLAGEAGQDGLIVLRSFGKFYGLAGVRLGFVMAGAADAARLADLAGPWNVSGAAIEIGSRALADRTWALDTSRRLAGEAVRLDALARTAGWTAAGGTALFRLYACADAAAARDHLARHHVWCRIFPWSRHHVRLGIPGGEDEWHRLEAAVRDCGP